MKKNNFLVFVVLCSFVIYSCASTTSVSEDQPKDEFVSENIDEDTENKTEADNLDDFENIESSEQNVKNSEDETGVSVSDNAEKENQIEGAESQTDNQTESKKDDFEIPAEIEEPLIRDLPVPEDIPDEPEINEKKDEDNSLEEPVTDIDTLEPIELLDHEKNDSVENEEKTEAIEIKNPEADSVDSEENSEIIAEDSFGNTDDSDSENTNIFETSENNENLTDSEQNTETTDTETVDEVEEEIVIIPSRSVSLKKGENLEVIYPGSGWVYMGSLSEYNNLASKGRKLGASDTKYTLLAKEPGTQIHHFYKIDNVTGFYIDDYIEVTVLDKKGSSKTTVTAPAYAEIIPEKPVIPAKASESLENSIENSDINGEKSTDKNSSETATAKSSQNNTTETAKTENSDRKNSQIKSDGKAETSEIKTMEYKPEDVISEEPEAVEDDELIVVDEDTFIPEQKVDTDLLLDNAQILYNEKQYAEANKLLLDFFEYSITRIDEALYLQGQILEADSEIKDVKAAIQSYDALVKNYPASTYWNDANKRIKYLRKFYYISN